MPSLKTRTPVTEVPPADPTSCLSHYEDLLRFETDCWDVHASLGGSDSGFVLVDVRSPELYSKGHVPGALNIPHRLLSERTLAAFAPETLFVVYCSGPHCNGADKAAARLARLGRPVKKMIGGITGWREEGFELEATGTCTS
jgi:rhodanese-related sulfurtransferase